MRSGERFGPATHHLSSHHARRASTPSFQRSRLTHLEPPSETNAKKTPKNHSGMDFYVVLDRPGYRVAKRRQRQARVGIQHRLTKEDAMKWFQQKFDGVVLNKSSY